MNICEKLQYAMTDEADAILFYNKLKNEMSPEHKEHIDTLERIIEDEYKHLSFIYNMMKVMNCPIEKAEEIEAKLKEMATEEDKREEKIEKKTEG